jgi:beta-glucosidase
MLGASTAMLAVAALGKEQKTPSKAFPAGFLWGAATAGHQIEGNNVNSDFWFLENIKPTIFAEPSGDACNNFELWRTDLDLAKSIGLNSYRFSLEWARIEPEPGMFSIAMLNHYQAIIDGCRARGLTPLVTFSHWTVPRWFAARGNWTNPDSPGLFARFCDRAARHLGKQIGYAMTFNEPNGVVIANLMVPPQAIAAQRPMLAAASAALGVPNFIGGPAFGHAPDMLDNMLKAHQLAKAAIKAAHPNLPVGATLAVADEQGLGTNSKRDAMRKAFYGAWLDGVSNDDFVGVQNYGRNVWDANGKVDAPADSKLNSEKEEVYAPSLAGAVRYVHAATKRPIMVTEHGVTTADDSLRAELIPTALTELKKAMNEGVPVLGYMHWSLIDNFEWVSGYRPTYGLAAVNRTTFERKLKPSAAVYGAIALRNAV